MITCNILYSQLQFIVFLILELDGPPTTKNVLQKTDHSQIPTPTPTPNATISPIGTSDIENKPKINSSVVPFNPIKYQYYQSGDCLNISILAKGILEEEVREPSFLAFTDKSPHIFIHFCEPSFSFC